MAYDEKETKYCFIDKKRFVNPYNFIPATTNRSVKNNEETLHTGVLECKIISKTPLAIPDAETVKEDNKHKKYKFFRYTYSDSEKLAIPGSTIRGMIRNVYETVTNSCFSTTKENQIITMRDTEVAKPGLLVRSDNDKWDLYDAKRCLLYVKDYERKDKKGNLNLSERQKKWDDSWVKVTREELREIGYGTKLYIEIVDMKKFYVTKSYSKEEKTNFEEGYLYIGEEIGKKHFEAVFVKEKIHTENLKCDALDVIYDTYNNKAINKKSDKNKFYKGYVDAKNSGCIPVWYLEDEYTKEIKLSLASIGRRTFDNTMGDVLKEKKSCDNISELCEACDLFGMTSAKGSRGSKIRFTDAICDSDNPKVAFKTLSELATPRITYFPFYVDGKSYDDIECEIRGRKYYWHNMRVDRIERINKVNKTKMNSTLEVVESGSGFNFKVFYDRITEKQLNQLIWTLTLGENEEKGKYCHKIGHGKPLGLGSVKIVVNKKSDRIIDGGYKINTVEDKEALQKVMNCDKDICNTKEILKICCIHSTKGMRVCYPYVICEDDNYYKANEKAAHKWFLHNKIGRKVGKTNSNGKKLPSIMEDDISLPVVKVYKK